MKNRIIILGVIAINIIGCATTKYSHINVLENKTQDGTHVDKVWVDETKLSDIKTIGIGIGEICIDSINDEKGITREDCREYLKKKLLEKAPSYGISIDDIDDNLKSKWVFTNMSPGDAASRVWAGEFGFGHANVEIQVIVFDQSGNRVIEISDSRNNSGNIGLRDSFSRDGGPEFVKEIIEQIATNILEELKLIING